MAFTLPVIPTSLPCPDGTVLNLPTKADLTNAIAKIGDVPSKLKVYLVTHADEITADAKEDIEKVIKDVEGFMEKLQSLASPYWEKGTVRNWGKEAKDAVEELLQEFHIYVPVKIMELISKIIPVSFNVTILGIDIDVLKVLTKEEQTKIKNQINENIDEFYALLPDSAKLFDGEFGVKCNEWKAKYTWKYIKTEIMDWVTNSIFKLGEELIGKFKDIWDALGLPKIPTAFEFDLESLIAGWKATAKAKYGEKTKEYNEYIKEKLESLTIAGIDLTTIIGGKIDLSVQSLEDKIASMIADFRDFKVNWKKKLLLEWVETVKKFLDAIGLGAILDLLTLTFCDLLKLIGFPFKIDITVPQEV
jgi:hypothetical protein